MSRPLLGHSWGKSVPPGDKWLPQGPPEGRISGVFLLGHKDGIKTFLVEGKKGKNMREERKEEN